jgi:hypothetical protein
MDEKLFNKVWEMIPTIECIEKQYPINEEAGEGEQLSVKAKQFGALWATNEIRKKLLDLINTENEASEE